MFRYLPLSRTIKWVKNLSEREVKTTQRTRILIPETFRPNPKFAKTSMEGRVIYEDIDYQFLKGEDMRIAGERIAKAFPSFTVWVTGGPWKGYDVQYQINFKNKIISIDFYSPRPGLEHIPDIISEIRAKLEEKSIPP